MSFFDDAISSIGQGLADTAVQSLSESTGIDVGGTLGFLFGGGQTTGGANLDNLGTVMNGIFGPGGKDPDGPVLDQITATLAQQTAAIDALGVQLTGISTELNNIEGEIAGIEAMLTKINQQELFNAWSNVDVQITEYIKAIYSSYVQYGLYVSNYATTPATEVAALAQNILNANDGPLAGLTTINALLTGNGGQSKGALQLWAEMVTPLVQQSILDYRLAVQQYFQYYQKLAYAELQATNLLMEAYIYNADKTDADDMWTLYKSQLLQQEDVFINWLVPLVYSGEIGGFFSVGSNTYTNFSFVEAASQLNPGLQCMVGDADPGNAFYEPSSIFQKAEQLLANLYVTDPADRRVVVHMLYSDQSTVSALLGGLDLTLDSQATGGGTANSVSGNILGSPFSFPGGGTPHPCADNNVYSGDGFYLKRYVFNDSARSGLSDGIYKLSDLNGHDGLVPMDLYGGNNVPFQQSSVINYSLEISSISKFDFMNFAAYTERQLSIV